MAIQEAFASSPPLGGENGGGPNNGHASLLSSRQTPGVGECGPPPPPLLPAAHACSSCSVSCSSTSSPPPMAPPSGGAHAGGIATCPARREFRRSLVYCGEIGKSLIDMGELSARQAGGCLPPTGAVACAAATVVSSLAAATSSFCPAGETSVQPPDSETDSCMGSCMDSCVDSCLDDSAACRLLKTNSSAQESQEPAFPPTQQATGTMAAGSYSASCAETAAASCPLPTISNGSVGGPLSRRSDSGRAPEPLTTLRVEKKNAATPPSRPAGRQAAPRHRFIINLDDKNKFTDEVTV